MKTYKHVSQCISNKLFEHDVHKNFWKKEILLKFFFCHFRIKIYFASLLGAYVLPFLKGEAFEYQLNYSALLLRFWDFR